MPKKNKDLTHLVKEAKIYASIEAKHQKLVEYLKKRGIKPSNKPIEQVEKDLLTSMQRQGKGWIYLNTRPLGKWRNITVYCQKKNSWQASLLTS